MYLFLYIKMSLNRNVLKMFETKKKITVATVKKDSDVLQKDSSDIITKLHNISNDLHKLETESKNVFNDISNKSGKGYDISNKSEAKKTPRIKA